MKGTSAILGAIVLVAAAGLVYWARVGTPVGVTGQVAPPHRSTPPDSSEGRGDDRGPQLGPAHGSRIDVPQPIAVTRQVVVPFEELSERSAANVALSEDEARWLRQNGYPSHWELHNLQSLDWQAIEAAAYRGDEVAQNLLAERLLAEGDVERAAAMFGNPRGMPSAYAMLRSSELQARLGRFPRVEDNYRQFMLHAEYARLMGDHQVDAVIQSVLPSTVDRQALQRAALRSLPDFARSQFDTAARTGLPPPHPSTRPNQDQWRQVRSGASQALTVQIRSPYMRPPGG